MHELQREQARRQDTGHLDDDRRGVACGGRRGRAAQALHVARAHARHATRGDEQEASQRRQRARREDRQPSHGDARGRRRQQRRAGLPREHRVRADHHRGVIGARAEGRQVDRQALAIGKRLVVRQGDGVAGRVDAVDDRDQAEAHRRDVGEAIEEPELRRPRRLDERHGLFATRATVAGDSRAATAGAAEGAAATEGPAPPARAARSSDGDARAAVAGLSACSTAPGTPGAPGGRIVRRREGAARARTADEERVPDAGRETSE